jgi:hypothetical protein
LARFVPGIGVDDDCLRVYCCRKGNDGAKRPDGDQRNHDHNLGGSGRERGHDSSPPVQGDGQHGEHAGRDRGEGEELVDGAVEGTKVPNSAIAKYKFNFYFLASLNDI